MRLNHRGRWRDLPPVHIEPGAHELEILTRGPPVARARCSCGAWRVDWTKHDLLRMGFADLATVEAALRQDHETHARGRAGLQERSARDPTFY